MKHQLLRVVGWGQLAPVAACVDRAPWVVVIVAGTLVVAARLVVEWQRRRTLIALVERAPVGTVVVQERGVGGPAMRVEIGCQPSRTGGRPECRTGAEPDAGAAT